MKILAVLPLFHLYYRWGQSVNCTASGSAAAGLYNNNVTVSAHDVYIPTLTVSKQAARSYMGTIQAQCPQECKTIVDNFFAILSSYTSSPNFIIPSCGLDPKGDQGQICQ